MAITEYLDHRELMMKSDFQCGLHPDVAVAKKTKIVEDVL